MNMSESIATCFDKFRTFEGRATRSEFWWFLSVSHSSNINDKLVK